jgi:DNA-binding CsgD family transcriptional regulator
MRRGRAVAALLRLGWNPPPLTDEQADRLLADLAAVRGSLVLSEGERLVLQHAADGETVEGTASILEVSPQTVMTATARIRRKLGARNTTHAVALALREETIT